MAKNPVISAVIHDLLNGQSFDNFSDLTEGIKSRCARLRIPYDAGRISDALSLVARTRPLLRQPAARRMWYVEQADDSRPLSKAEAADLWPRLLAVAKRWTRR
jgi:hypothetical protein